MAFSSRQQVSIMSIEVRRFQIILTQIFSYLNIFINLTHLHIERGNYNLENIFKTSLA